MRHRKWRPGSQPTPGPTHQMPQRGRSSLRCPPVLRSAAPGTAPPRILRHAAANTKELATQHENGGIRPTNHSTFSQVHTCRGIWAPSGYVVAKQHRRGLQTCTTAFSQPARVPDSRNLENAQNFVQGGAGWLFIRCISGFPQRPRPCGQAHGRGPLASRALENSRRVFGEDAGDNAVPPRHACCTRPFARTLDG